MHCDGYKKNNSYCLAWDNRYTNNSVIMSANQYIGQALVSNREHTSSCFLLLFMDPKRFIVVNTLFWNSLQPNQKTWLMPLSKVICSRAFNLSRMITRKCLNVVFWHNYHTTLFSVVLFKFSFAVIFQPPCCLLIQHPIIIFSLLLYPI